MSRYAKLLAKCAPAATHVLEQKEGRYYLNLTGGDEVFWFANAPAEFDANIDKRIWVTGSMEDTPVRFGVID